MAWKSNAKAVFIRVLTAVIQTKLNSSSTFGVDFEKIHGDTHNCNFFVICTFCALYGKNKKLGNLGSQD
jgi:hypothetical protein